MSGGSRTSRWAPPREFDEYALIRPLGQGQMGEVYLAQDKLLARHVAIKFLGEFAPGSLARKRFFVEARAAARLQHPNVVTIHRVGELDARPFLVSEFVRGETLDSIKRPISWERALEIGVGLARGLGAAHKSGVLHRDIKPANAILAEDGHPKLLDFGLAKVVEVFEEEATQSLGELVPFPGGRDTMPSTDRKASHDVDSIAAFLGGTDDPFADGSPFARTIAAQETAGATILSGTDSPRGLTGAGTILGTPDYMSPEIWRGEPATTESDVYSLGALLYELVSGHPPHHEQETMRDLCYASQRGVPPLSIHAPSCDARLAMIIERCLVPNRDDRYRTGEQLREALEALQRDLLTSVAVPEGNPYRGLRPFEAQDRDLFVGRDGEISVIVDRIRIDPFVLVAGDSGIGKSSLCRAGVLPIISARGLEDGRTWKIVTTTPTRSISANVASALARAAEIDDTQADTRLALDVSRFISEIRFGLGQDRALLWFIDPIDDVLALAAPGELELVEDLISRIAASDQPIRVLATTRSESLTRLAALPSLGDEISRALYLLRPLSREKFRTVIVAPASRTGVRFENEALVQTLVEETVHERGGLPLLQFALSELWEARDQGSKLITARTLERMGGVAGALARHADAVITSMIPVQRTAARNVLIRLVSPSMDRVRKTREELTGGDPSLESALERLVGGRLVVSMDDEGGSSYQLAHDILIHSWDALRRWLSEDDETRRARERVARAAAEWVRLGKPREALWGEIQLEDTAQLARDALHANEAEFLSRSRSAVNRAKWLRRALMIAGPLLIAAVYATTEVRARIALDARIAELVRQARTHLELATQEASEGAAARELAFRSFDTRSRSEGEAAWARALDHEDRAEQAYLNASQASESALSLARSRPDLGELLGGILFDRAVLAERRGRLEDANELMTRLVLYDPKGGLRSRWSKKGIVHIRTNSPAALLVESYALGAKAAAAAHVVARHEQAPEQMLLEPGSYRLTVEVPKRPPLVHPIVVRRSEELKLELDPPRAVPQGYVYIAKGRSRFGSTAGEESRATFYDAVPVHDVETGPYLIGQNEVTYEDWIAFLDSLPPAEQLAHTPGLSTSNTIAGGASLSKTKGGWTITVRAGSANIEAERGEPLIYRTRTRPRAQRWERFPVTGVSAKDAEAYAAWLRSSEKLPGARLCTEQEWERAARGADDREYPHGGELHPEDANFDRTYGKEPAAMGPDEVGSFSGSKSPYGLFDMTGNAYEWTTSSLEEGEYVARGGSYFHDATTNRISNRLVLDRTLRDPSLGLRICASISAD
jgi:eukaryotic-like serine/threonine-protein kinase